MKKINNGVKVAVYLIVAILIFIVLLKSINGISTKNNSSPEMLYKNNNSIDFLVYQDTAFVNASDSDWIQELELPPEKELGVIQRTNIQKNYKDFDATKLAEGTKIYSVKARKDILLVLINEEYIPYYQYVEG